MRELIKRIAKEDSGEVRIRTGGNASQRPDGKDGADTGQIHTQVAHTSRVRSLPLLFVVDALHQSADRRVVQLQVTSDFHLAIPVLIDRSPNQAVPLSLPTPSLIE